MTRAGGGAKLPTSVAARLASSDRRNRMRRVLRDNGLSITMFALFLIFLVAQSIAGYKANNTGSHRSPTAST
jgi:hypothetical protein